MPAPHYFITGATGLIGSHLARHLLAAGSPVTALKRAGSSLALVQDIANQIEWVEGDVLDMPLLTATFAHADVVIHAAALVQFQPRHAEAMRQVNVEGTANVVNACLLAGVKKMCYLSSVAALGKAGADGKITEKAMWDSQAATTRYAESKHFGEREVWRGMAEGLNAVIVNPSVVLGEGLLGQSTGQLFQYVANGARYYPSGLINLVDVLDVARAIQQLCESEIRGEKFILNAVNMPYQAFFGAVAHALGRPGPTRLLTPGLAWAVLGLARLSAIFTGDSPKLTGEVVRAASQQHRYSAQKVEAALGFQFSPIDQTIARVGAYFRARQ